MYQQIKDVNSIRSDWYRRRLTVVRTLVVADLAYFNGRGQVPKTQRSRCRRRHRGGIWEGVSQPPPLPIGEWIRAGYAPPQNKFRIKMAHFDAFWRVIINIKDLLLRGLKHVLQTYNILTRSRPPQQPVWSVTFPHGTAV